MLSSKRVRLFSGFGAACALFLVTRDEAHGEAVLVFHRLLRQVVGLPDAVQRAALAGTHRVARQQSDQDGLHHHHGDMFANTGTRPAAKGLEEAAGHLPKQRK